ncbi:MAG: hypothetical protein II920_03315 [Clostridia bacterium]|nr:hypothetical protein [Clostridia bacterium]
MKNNLNTLTAQYIAGHRLFFRLMPFTSMRAHGLNERLCQPELYDCVNELKGGLEE